MTAKNPSPLKVPLKANGIKILDARGNRIAIFCGTTEDFPEYSNYFKSIAHRVNCFDELVGALEDLTTICQHPVNLENGCDCRICNAHRALVAAKERP